LGYGVRHSHGFQGAVEDFVSDAADEMGWHWEPQPPPRLDEAPGIALSEIYGALDGFAAGDEKYSAKFGRDIIASIPPGSIYLGGSDPGRNVVSAMCRSQIDGDPFFTLAQNSFGNSKYLEYLQGMYGKTIYIPTDADFDNCRDDYLASLQRQDWHREPPTAADIMDFPGSVAKMLFDKNPQREFFVEEEYPIDWMYLQLEPHGLIFKLNRQPAPKLSNETVQRDHEYWKQYVQPLIGDWLKEDTTITEIAAFAEQTRARQDFSAFRGDRRFIQSACAQEMYSRLRSAIGGLYEWRANHATNMADKSLMLREADFAFKQAWALDPASPEVTYRYINFLADRSRTNDALTIAQVALDISRMTSRNSMEYDEIIKRLKQAPPEQQPAVL
jgi:hypothetical protein